MKRSRKDLITGRQTRHSRQIYAGFVCLEQHERARKRSYGEEALNGISSIEIAHESSAQYAESHRELDPRWQLTKRVVEGRHFSRSPLLARFLLYIVEKTLERRQSEITEHRIGVQVFGRPSSYRTVEDNIVRNYARQLRKRLGEHFSADPSESIRIEIPLGGYVPAFVPSEINEDRATSESSGVRSRAGLLLAAKAEPWIFRFPAWARHRRVILGVLIAAYSACLIAMTWRISIRPPVAVRHEEAAGSALWKAIFNDDRMTYVVPPDAGLNLVEDLSHHPVPLAEYIQGSYLASPLPHFDSHSADDLRLHQFTDFSNLQIMAAIARLPEYSPRRASLRFPRDLRLDDLKSSNAIIIGSVCSNPWAELADAKANFVIVCSEGMESSSIVNRHPQTLEQTSYASHWNEPTHVTYSLVSCFPNLSGSGSLLFLEGLDVAGSQAAAEAVLQPNLIQPILQRAARPDGSFRRFEVLLRSTSIQSNATDTQVIASRVD